MAYVGKLKRERQKTAYHRFFLKTLKPRETWRFLACDSSRSLGDVTIGKFKAESDAEFFLSAKRKEYVNETVADS
jgi:hypothetical protein